ncbi:SAV_2336 N-terminal domain-related protein [Actinomadura sp. 1N219]|uniref:SAV_2336 N-terminal domain-related protein n=1 Tax=Actinomadura sp. 1N219 TaxID=3375152 RepID=UPI0037AA1F1E
MTIDRLRDALSAIGPPPDARELSEMLWLACHISPPEEQARPARPVETEEPAEPPRPAAPSAPSAPAPPPPAREPHSRLHPRPAPGAAAGPVGEASEVLVPTAPMLADPLGVQRALRPLKRRVPSRHRFELDEDATAARIAETRLWTPVLVPSPERWLSLSLVVDTGPTMRLWRPLARELAETLLRQGAFQDVHLGYLDATGGITATPDAPRQDPGTLLDASGRHAVLVLSDCSGPHWWNGRAAEAVRRWAQTGPTAILQPLAERLWRRTAAPATPGVAFLPRPAAPNTDLRFTPYDGAAAPGIPVPVLEASPRWFGAWARLVSGSDPQPAAVATIPSRPAGTTPVRRERELTIGERVRRFLATASPDAAELAAHVAVSVPSLPVMRLIQHRILGGSGPGQLAEVLLSGLLRPAGGVRYEFVPGAREALLDTLPRPEALHTRRVLEAVSAEIERRAGTSADQFRALLPTEGGPVTLTADTDHFALLTPQTRSHLVPAPPAPDLLDLLGTPVDELLGDGWGRRPPNPIPIGVDGKGETARIDILRRGVANKLWLIFGPRRDRDALLRTIVLGLALNHSPSTVTFSFVDFSGGTSFVGLGSLPHVTTAVHTTSTDSPLIGQLPWVLESERRRRETILQAAGIPTWDEYQTAIADGRPLDPLPALIVILDNAVPLFEARHDMLEPIINLCEAGPAQGIRFILSSPETSPPPPRLAEFAGWRANFPAAEDGVNSGSLMTELKTHFGFRPARISLDVSDPIVERMRQRGPRASRLAWRTEPPAGTAPSHITPRPGLAPENDVLSLNGGDPSAEFEETWALPASTPRNPAVGHDADGNVVTLYPLDLSSGLPHGLVAGETEARQRVIRAITLALAATSSPSDVILAFAGLGEHPLGDPIALPHVVYSEDELLGRPEKLQEFFRFLTDELDARAAEGAPESMVEELLSRDAPRPPPGPPRLLVVADVSLTFPSSRREVGEALLSLAQRGRSLGVQLLLTSTSVENTTMWSRFLPLLGWRIAAGRLPPAELQRVLGRANLPFADDRTAYLLAGGGTPRPFTVAPEPPEAALNDFLERTRSRSRAASPTADDLPQLAARFGSLLNTYEGLLVRLGGGHEAVAAFGVFVNEEIESRRAGRAPGPRHLVFEGTRPAQVMSACAELYAELLGELGVVSTGGPVEASSEALNDLDLMNTVGAVLEQFEAALGKVLFFHVAEDVSLREDPSRSAIGTALNMAMDEFSDDPVVILYGEAPVLGRLWERTPGLRDRFRRTVSFTEDEARPGPDVAPSATVADTRIPLGVDVDTDEPVLLDFTTDQHLLISGPSGSGKARLLSHLYGKIRTRVEGDLYFLDGEDYISGRRTASGGDSPAADEFRRRLREVVGRVEHRGRTGHGADVCLVMRNRRWLLQDDPLRPLLPLLRSSAENGLRLVVSRHQISFGEPRDPLVETLHALGAPVLLLGHAGGQEADLWDVPSALRRPIPHGQALLVQSDRRRFIRLPLFHIGSDGP